MNIIFVIRQVAQEQRQPKYKATSIPLIAHVVNARCFRTDVENVYRISRNADSRQV